MPNYVKLSWFPCLILSVFTAIVLNSELLAADDKQVPPLPEGAFSFVVLPDTQGYVSTETQPIFEAEVQWILDNKDSQNIQFVSHVGDIVDEYESMKEWEIAKRAMSKLHGVVPFAFSVGNHDMTKEGISDNFQKTFPASSFHKYDWYAGEIKNNADSFQLFEVNGMKFLWLHIECNAPDEVLDWANRVFKEYPDRRAIVTTHMCLGPLERPETKQGYHDDPKGRMKWNKTHGENGNSPQQMWEKCFSLHKNLFMICCGDQSRTQAMYLGAKGKHGNLVHQCLSDYRGGNFRILQFDPKKDEINVITYSASDKKLCEGSKIAPDRDAHQFVLKYDMEEARK